MAQNYTRPSTQTGTPAQLRQALGYQPARAATGADGVEVTGGPSGQAFTLTPISAGAVLGNLGPGDASPHTVDFTFVKLTDTFGSFSGLALQAIRVNAGETALEPYTPSLTPTYTYIRLIPVAVAALPPPVDGGFAFVNNATLTAITGLGLAVTGGGANHVPVYSDGVNWIIL